MVRRGRRAVLRRRTAVGAGAAAVEPLVVARTTSPRRLPLGAALLALLAGAVLVPAAHAAPVAHAGPKTMVALGDSFAAGPLIPPQVDERPWGCLRSSLNYAHQVAQALALELTDVTCSGASTKHMWETHGVSPPTDGPPQPPPHPPPPPPKSRD